MDTDHDLSEKRTMVGLSTSGGVGMWLMAGFLGLAAVAQVSSSRLVYHCNERYVAFFPYNSPCNCWQ